MSIKLQSVIRIPANVIGGDGITVEQDGITLTIAVDPDTLPAAIGVLDPENGGTGVANTNTLTISGGDVSFTFSGTATVAFGAGGTIAYQDGALGTPSSVTLTNATGLLISGITGLGTGVGTALAVAVGSAGAPVVNGGALGTPSSGVGTNITNVNAATLGGATFAAPGAIGGGTPAAGTFTTLTVTSINGMTVTSSTGTFTLTNGKTLSVSNTLTFTGTDGSTVACGAGGTVAYTTGAEVVASVAVDFNTTNTDHAITIPTSLTNYLVRNVYISNSGTTASLTTARGGIFSATGGGGVAITNDFALSGLTQKNDDTAANIISAAINSSARFNRTNTPTIYYRNSTAQGAAATGRVMLILVPIA